ncbi:hypothetical protein HanRHA438_Chr10g0480261 [Helianthus annuus]|nr:hypothetical protein HanRHA438_Chr10g0480261 [Helianthus annuus]
MGSSGRTKVGGELMDLISLGAGCSAAVHLLEGDIVARRMDTIFQFYGDPYLTTGDILVGTVDRPKAVCCSGRPLL